MRLWVVAIIVCCSIPAFADAEPQDYLNETVFSLPTNGSKIRTPQSLAPYTSYRIKISSAYNLKPVYSENHEGYETDIQIDGKTIKAESFEVGADGYISNVEFIYRGLGKPLYLGFGRDYHREIESAHVKIYAEGWLERVWRERLGKIWGAYGEWIVFTAILLPLLVFGGVYYLKHNRKIRAEERQAESHRQSIMLKSHTKSIELMREIDRRAQQKAQEIMSMNYDELQRKVMYWRTRAYTESYFLNPELRKHFAIANRDNILSELEGKWAKEFLEIAQDLPLAKALREQEPGVLHWIHARQDVVNLAHNLAWAANPFVDAQFEEVPYSPPVIVVDEMEETETFTKARARKTG